MPLTLVILREPPTSLMLISKGKLLVGYQLVLFVYEDVSIIFSSRTLPPDCSDQKITLAIAQDIWEGP